MFSLRSVCQYRYINIFSLLKQERRSLFLVLSCLLPNTVVRQMIITTIARTTVVSWTINHCFTLSAARKRPSQAMSHLIHVYVMTHSREVGLRTIRYPVLHLVRLGPDSKLGIVNYACMRKSATASFVKLAHPLEYVRIAEVQITWLETVSIQQQPNFKHSSMSDIQGGDEITKWGEKKTKLQANCCRI